MLKKIMYFVLIILSLILIFFFFLKKGINIHSFSLGNMNISQLYLKLDKKLILKIKEFKINKKSQVNSSLEDLSQTLKKVPQVLNLFQEIDIKSLQINGNKFIISFNKNYIYLDNKFIKFSAKANFYENKIKLDLDKLYLKDYDVLFVGKINIDLDKYKLDFMSEFIVNKLKGNINITANEFKTKIFLESETIQDLHFLKKFFRLPKIAEDWIYENIEGDKRVKSFSFEINNKTSQVIKESIKAEVIVKKAKIFFERKLPAVETDKINIIYNNDTLLIDLNKAKYLKKDLLGSKVTINNISNKKGIVSVLIKTNTLLDKNILDLLSFYKIKLPLIQKTGNTKASVLLEFPYDKNKPFQVSGDFIIENALVSLNGFEIYSNQTKVKLKNSSVKIYDSIIEAKDLFKTSLDLDINLKTKNADGFIVLDYFKIKNKKSNLVYIKDYKSKISLDFTKTTKLSIKSLNTDILLANKSTDITVNDISLVYQYSEILKSLDIKKGKIDVSVFNKNKITFKAKVYDLSLPIKYKNNKIENLSIYGSLINNKLNLNTLDKKIKIFTNKNDKLFIQAKDLDLILYGGDKESSLPDLDLILTNINIYTSAKEKYSFSRINASIKDNKIVFDADIHHLDIPLKKNNKKITNLNIIGSYINKNLEFFSKNKSINFLLNKNNQLFLKINNLDLIYEDNDTNEKSTFSSIIIKGNNSNIYFSENNKILAKSYNIKIIDEDIVINTYYNKSSLYYKIDKHSNIIVKAINLNDEFMNSFFDKKIIRGGLYNVSASGRYGILKGKAYINDSSITNMAIVNNLIILVNSSPALINPLLAIPAVFELVTQDGFDLKGYKISKGEIDFKYNISHKTLNMSKIITKGNSVDFEGFLDLDFSNNTISGDMDVIFMKSYALLVKYIPLVNYLLLGDDKRVDTQVNISGSISDPKIETNLTKNSLTAPFNIIKRIITLPIKAVESLIPEDKTKK